MKTFCVIDGFTRRIASGRTVRSYTGNSCQSAAVFFRERYVNVKSRQHWRRSRSRQKVAVDFSKGCSGATAPSEDRTKIWNSSKIFVSFSRWQNRAKTNNNRWNFKHKKHL